MVAVAPIVVEASQQQQQQQQQAYNSFFFVYATETLFRSVSGQPINTNGFDRNIISSFFSIRSNLLLELFSYLFSQN